MADKKISQLSVAASLTGSEPIPLVQGGATLQASVNQIQTAPISAQSANGVMYLNGSKVPTAGTGLVFDGTDLGIGTTAPLALVHVSGTGLGTNGIRIDSTSSSSPRPATLTFSRTDSTLQSLQFVGSINFIRLLSDGSSNTPATIFVTGSNNSAAPAGNLISDALTSHSWRIASLDAMTLDASSNLGIGTSSPAQRLDVTGAAQNSVQARFGNVAGRGLEIGTSLVSGTNDAGSVLNAKGAASGTLIFQTDSTERARITSGGDLLVGTSSLAGAGGISFQSQGGTGFAVINNNNAGATGYVFSSFRRSSTEIGSVTQNGTTAVLFNTTSDRRLKDNIVPAPSASAVIDAIEIVSHDWKSAPDEHVTYGVIAQDLALVAPQAVLQGDDGEEIEKTWGVDYSKLVPMLIKEIQSLRARVAALEAA